MRDNEQHDPDEAMKNLDKLTDRVFSVTDEDEDEAVVEETETTEIVEED